jgi:hypothetical protein
LQQASNLAAHDTAAEHANRELFRARVHEPILSQML